jgi:hypothetical protein
MRSRTLAIRCVMVSVSIGLIVPCLGEAGTRGREDAGTRGREEVRGER